MLYVWIAISALFLCNIAALGVALRAGVRVTNFQKSQKDLDWEAVAKLTGDVGSVKRAIQQVNNRINGMESSKGRQSDALAAAQAYAAQQAQTNVRTLTG